MRFARLDLFGYLDWQRRAGAQQGRRSGLVAASTMNRRVSTVRSWFEFLVMIGVLAENPVPKARRSSGLRMPRARNARSRRSDAGPFRWWPAGDAT